MNKLGMPIAVSTGRIEMPHSNMTEVPITVRNKERMDEVFTEFAEKATDLGFDSFFVIATNKEDIQALRGLTKVHSKACAALQLKIIEKLVENMNPLVAAMVLMGLLDGLKERMS